MYVIYHWVLGISKEKIVLLSDLFVEWSRINLAKIRPSAWACLSVPPCAHGKWRTVERNVMKCNIGFFLLKYIDVFQFLVKILQIENGHFTCRVLSLFANLHLNSLNMYRRERTAVFEINGRELLVILHLRSYVRNATEAHAQDVAASDELLLSILKAFAQSTFSLRAPRNA
jgi:hypothetical protein